MIAARRLRSWFAAVMGILLLAGCARPAAAPASPSPSAAAREAEAAATASLSPVDLAGGPLRVVATTNIVGDVVARIGGDRIQLTTLMPPGVDPHGYQLTPGDRRSLDDAHVIFVNGLGLEEGVLSVVHELDGSAPVITVNAGVATIALDQADGEHNADHGVDPHTWLSVPAVIVWTDTVATTLAALDPAQAGDYAAAAASYRDELSALDAEIRDLTASVPEQRRKLVTDHHALDYFAAEYGYVLVGTVLPSLSTLAAPSAQDIARLEEQIKAEGVPAIFVGATAGPALAQQVAADLGIQIVTIYTGSLSEAGGPAPSYLALMRTNARAIAEALR